MNETAKKILIWGGVAVAVLGVVIYRKSRQAAPTPPVSTDEEPTGIFNGNEDSELYSGMYFTN